MAANTNSGFTIIELILFLALTGLFMIIALAGVGGRSGRVQFTDSMRSLSSYLQRQYSDTLNGVNLREGNGCTYGAGAYSINLSGSHNVGQSNCSIMGKVVVFSAGSVTADVYVIVGRFLSQTVDSGTPNYLDPTKSDAQLIADAQPVVLRGSDFSDAYDLEWQTEFVDLSGAEYNAIAFVRSPRSSNIYPVTFRANWSSESTPALDISNLAAPASYCFLGANGQDAEIIVGGNNRSDGIELAFDTGCS